MRSAIPLLIPLLIASLLGCSRDEDGVAARATARAVAAEPTSREVEAELGLASPEIATWLRQQPWVHDSDDETLRAVTAIVTAQNHTDPSTTGQRRKEAIGLIQGLSKSSWYTGTLRSSEKLFVAAVFNLYSKSQQATTASVETMPEYPWPTMLAMALQEKLHVAHVSPDGREVQLLAVAKSTSSTGITALTTATDMLSKLEGLLGPYQAPAILFIEDEGLTSTHGEVCGQADSSLRIVFYKPSCLNEEVIAHELVHLMTPRYASVWFEEGSAFLLGALASSTSLLDRRPPGTNTYKFHVGGIFDPVVDGPAYFEEALAGLYFLHDYVQSFGYEALLKVIRTRTDPFTSDTDLLAALVEEAPADRRRFVPAFIAEHCRVRVGEHDVPC